MGQGPQAGVQEVGAGGRGLGTEPPGLARATRAPCAEEAAQGRLLGVRRPLRRVRSRGARGCPRDGFQGSGPRLVGWGLGWGGAVPGWGAEPRGAGPGAGFEPPWGGSGCRGGRGPGSHGVGRAPRVGGARARAAVWPRGCLALAERPALGPEGMALGSGRAGQG